MKLGKLRCLNKPIKFISAYLKIDEKEVKRIVYRVKEDAQQYLEELVSEWKPKGIFFKDITGLLKRSDFTLEYAIRLLTNEDVLNFIYANLHQTHNRYLDCVKFHVLLLQ